MDKLYEKLNWIKELVTETKLLSKTGVPDWEFVKQIDNMTMLRRFLPGSDIACFKSNGLIAANTRMLSDYIWKTFNSEENMKVNDGNILKYEVVENIDENTRICHQINSLPWPLWPREFVFIQSRVIEPDGTYIYMYSVDHKKVPPQPTKYVRATINISGFVFKPKDNECMVHRLAHIEPNGLIPTAVVNNYSDKTMLMIRKMRNHFHDFATLSS